MAVKFVEGQTVGIDLGTTYSSIAQLDDEGNPQLIKNVDGRDITPSVVLLGDGDRVVVGPSFARIAEEDPSISVDREPDTLEVLLGGLGDTHLDVAAEKMKRKFGVEIMLELPKVPYKETISVQTRVEYKHKKQSGGHGQYGHVLLRLEPQPRGEGYVFASEVVGGNVPKEYIPAVEKGVGKALGEGGITGYPIVDLKVVLYDGSSPPVAQINMERF